MEAGDARQVFRPLQGRDSAPLDIKNRVLIPKKMRERLGPDFALWLSETGCIVAQPGPLWDRKVAELLSKEASYRGCDVLKRSVFSTSDDMQNCDEQGRIVLAESLRIAAKLCDDQGQRLCERVEILGAGDRVEIWSPTELAIYEQQKFTYKEERRAEFEQAYEMMRAAPSAFHPIEEALRMRLG